jgi:hypothetical protein
MSQPGGGPPFNNISLNVVADSFGFFSVTGTIPVTATPADYVIRVFFVGPAPSPNIFPCTITVQGVAPTASPTPGPTATATPTAVPAATPRGIDADDLADILAALARNGGGGPQQQQQQQQQAIPVVLPGVGVASDGGSKLPKTGFDAAEVGGLGTVSLLTGVSLMEFARRRRRNWIAPASAAEAMATTPKVAMAEPVGGESDLLLPYSAPTAIAVEPPASAEPRDFITPTF